MAKEAKSNNSIARAVYDSDLEAIRTTNSSTEIGTNAGSRKSGIMIILQDANDLYIAIGETADGNSGALTQENESIFLPTNASVYGLSADSGGSAISYWEI